MGALTPTFCGPPLKTKNKKQMLKNKPPMGPVLFWGFWGGVGVGVGWGLGGTGGGALWTLPLWAHQTLFFGLRSQTGLAPPKTNSQVLFLGPFRVPGKKFNLVRLTETRISHPFSFNLAGSFFPNGVVRLVPAPPVRCHSQPIRPTPLEHVTTPTGHSPSPTPPPSQFCFLHDEHSPLRFFFCTAGHG